MAMLFFPFRKEVVLYSSKEEKLYSSCLYWWCSSPFIPPEIYSWYLHPSEIDILDNNLLQKNHSPSIDPFRKSYLIFLEAVNYSTDCHITFPSLLIKLPFEREGGVEEKENQLHKCTQESQAPHPTLYFGYIILPLKMLTFLCTRSLLLSPSFWRDPAVTMHKLELAVTA